MMFSTWRGLKELACAFSTTEPYRACHRRLEDDAPSDDELGDEVVGAGGQDNVGDGGVGKCIGQAGNGAHGGLQLTAVARHKLHEVHSGNVAGLGAGQHSAWERQRRQ